MQQDLITQIINTGSQHIWLSSLCHFELGLPGLSEYLMYLGIEPICFISTRSLSGHQEAMAQVEQPSRPRRFLPQQVSRPCTSGQLIEQGCHGYDHGSLFCPLPSKPTFPL
jgi:hypothetical protein